MKNLDKFIPTNIIVDPIEEYRQLLKNDPVAAKSYYDRMLTADQQKQISQLAPGLVLTETRIMGETGGVQFVEETFIITLPPKPPSEG